jgi:Abortive infection alpha
VLEGIRYEPEGTPIDEMFSQLLSRSMDSDRVGEAHPAFPIIIRQLSSDEALILRLLSEAQYDFVYTSNWDDTTKLFSGRKIETDALPRDELAFPNNIGFYMDHLHQLGLAGIFQHGNQVPLSTGGKQTGVGVISKYRLTDLGHRFVHACIGGHQA